MDLAAVRALALDVEFKAFGVPAMVTVPGGAPVDATVRWLTPVMEDMPGGFDLRRREVKRLAVLRRSEVPIVPLGTAILAPEVKTGPVLLWRVDGFERTDSVHVRAFVIPGV